MVIICSMENNGGISYSTKNQLNDMVGFFGASSLYVTSQLKILKYINQHNIVMNNISFNFEVEFYV